MANWSPFDPETDRRLVVSVNEGDEDAFATLYDLYVERLYDYCLSMVREPKAAADIVHDTFIDAFRRAPRMRNRGRLRSWLYAAARRRCLQRTRPRTRGLHWDWSGETATGIDPGSARPIGDLRSVLEGVLQRLDFGDQELLLLALRHGVIGEDLGAVLGVPVRRANARVAQALSLAESALTTEVLSRCGRCAAERPADLAAHAAKCPDCRPYAQMSVSALLTAPPIPVLPAGLRHRVMHTGADSELAGYRAEIAARGGHLNPDGMPRQPDVPSPMVRRWIFTGSGVVGALAAALLLALIIGPSLPNTEIEWPWRHRPSPGGGTPWKGQQIHQPAGPPTVQRGEANPTDPVVPQLDGHAMTDTPMPQGSPQGVSQGTSQGVSQASPQPQKPGELAVTPAAVTLRVGQETHLELSALRGPVTWSAVSSTDQLELAVDQGTIAQDGAYTLTITLTGALVQLPGQAVITFTSTTGHAQQVEVTWKLSLLNP
jgi:RNA polymerase sigma factor (sigma-70 family)